MLMHIISPTPSHLRRSSALAMAEPNAGSLTPNISPLSRRWKPFIENDDLSCYSFYLPHDDSISSDGNVNASENDTPTAFTNAQLNGWFHALHPSNYKDEPTSSAWTDAIYKNQKLLRKTAWHTFDEECTCEYGYSDTWQPLVTSLKMQHVLKEITSTVVSKAVGLKNGELNSVNLNYYPQGGGVGFHADDEFLFDGLNRETRIISLSLCSTTASNNVDKDDCNDHNNNFGARTFQVKRKGKKHDSTINEIILRHGDLMTMEGMFQKYYLHSVWPGDSMQHVDHEQCQGERINLTWRTIVRHLDGSEECNGLVCPLSGKER